MNKTQDNAFRIEVVPDAFSIGLFKGALASRKRLRITTAIAVVALWAAFMFMSWFLRSYSIWPTLNIFLLIALLGGVIFISYLVALTIGDAVFPGPWREKMRLGSKFVPDNINDEAALLKNKSIYFILLWFVSILAVLFGCDFASGRVVTWYSNVGGALVSLKSDDPSDRLASLNALTNPLRTTAWNDESVRAEIVKCVSDPDPEIASLAAYVAGRAEIVEAAEALTANVKNKTLQEHVRAESAATLGRIAWKPARAAMISTLNATFAEDPKNKELIPAIFFAFFDIEKDKMAIQPAVQILNNCLQTECSDEVLQYTFFYLKSVKAQQSSEIAFKYIDSPTVPLKTKCLAADSLRFTAPVSSIPDLKMRYDRTPIDAQCDDVFRKYHMEAAIQMFEHDPMRALFIRAVGNHMRKSDYDWIYAIGTDTNEKPETRKVCEIYTRAMNEKAK